MNHEDSNRAKEILQSKYLGSYQKRDHAKIEVLYPEGKQGKEWGAEIFSRHKSFDLFPATCPSFQENSILQHISPL